MDENELQKLRESSGLRLDKEGRFFLRDEPIEHERTIEVLRRGIHRAPDGRWATRIGKEWAYLQVDDVAVFVTSVSASGELRGRLWTGEDVGLSGLFAGAEDALYTRINGERARLTRAAQASLLPRLREESGKYFLDLGGGRLPIRADTGPEPCRDDSGHTG